MSTHYPYVDQNHQPLPITAASMMTDENQYEARCGMCAREIYLDEDAHRIYSEALISGKQNQFRCEVCSEEY